MTFDGVYQFGREKIFTKNLVPGKKVYGESLMQKDGTEFRQWDPWKSKLGAGIVKGVNRLGFMPGDTVLYLGAASGTTVSHVSDIVGKNGVVFALDFAPRVVRDLVFLCEDRKNIAPMLADAKFPESYQQLMFPQVDFLFMDIAQKAQTDIFTRNVEMYLKKSGIGMLALKARSVDVTKKPREIFNSVRNELKQKYEIIDEVSLEPFERDHALFVIRKLN